MNFQDNSANWLAWRPFYVDFDVENESVTESLQKKKKQEKTVNLHKAYNHH